eukprot:gene5010-3605_t
MPSSFSMKRSSIFFPLYPSLSLSLSLSLWLFVTVGEREVPTRVTYFALLPTPQSDAAHIFVFCHPVPFRAEDSLGRNAKRHTTFVVSCGRNLIKSFIQRVTCISPGGVPSAFHNFFMSSVSRQRHTVAVLHDARDSKEQVESAVKLLSTTTIGSDAVLETFPVGTGPSLFRAIRHLRGAGCRAAVNLCTGSNEDTESASASLVALLLEQNGLPYTGCRSDTLGYPADVVFMMMWYAGIPLPRFWVVHSVEEAEAALACSAAPLRARPTSSWCSPGDILLPNEGAQEALVKAMSANGPMLVYEVPGERDTDDRVKVMVTVCSSCQSPLFSYSASVGTLQMASWPSLAEKLQAWGTALLKLVLYDVGFATLSFSVKRSSLTGLELKLNAEDCVLDNIVFNPPLMSPTRGDVVHSGAERSSIAEALCAEAERRAPRPTFSIELHEDSRKGYRLCAARDIHKGDVVFEDEGRAFAVVTRPHVQAHWDDELKRTFTEYAWPLDSEGHVYAIWEKNPSRWRPINHCCDPNCIFAAPHSLNVIAARNIAKGEDLTMDYATFCDGTMKPFECLCGASVCRRWIQADQTSLEKYGENAWFRRLPAPLNGATFHFFYLSSGIYAQLAKLFVFTLASIDVRPVNGESMTPTIMPHDCVLLATSRFLHVLTWAFPRYFQLVRQGDVVLVTLDTNITVCKRVTRVCSSRDEADAFEAAAFSTLDEHMAYYQAMEEQQASEDGRAPQPPAKPIRSLNWDTDRTKAAWGSSRGWMWLEGDNPKESFDSRHCGFVPVDCLTARVLAVIYPTPHRLPPPPYVTLTTHSPSVSPAINPHDKDISNRLSPFPQRQDASKPIHALNPVLAQAPLEKLFVNIIVQQNATVNTKLPSAHFFVFLPQLISPRDRHS